MFVSWWQDTRFSCPAMNDLPDGLPPNSMTDQLLLQRITADPHIVTGKPVIKGTRLSVEYILNLLGHGATPEEILHEYDGLVPEDIYACFLFAAL